MYKNKGGRRNNADPKSKLAVDLNFYILYCLLFQNMVHGEGKLCESSTCLDFWHGVLGYVVGVKLFDIRRKK